MASRSGLQNSFLLKWRIENFSVCLKKNRGEFLESPKFLDNSSPNEQWSLRLYPKGMNSDAYLSFQLCRNARFNTPQLVHTGENIDFVFGILAKDGLTMIRDQIHRTKFSTQSSESRIYDFVKLEELSSRESCFLPQDTLTIQCNLMRPVKQHILTIRYQVERLSFTWIIKHFSKIHLSQFDPDDYSYTVPISCARAPRLVLKLQLVGKSIAESHLRINCTRYSPSRWNSSSCSSGCKHVDPSYISVSFLFSISDTNGRKNRLVECEYSFTSKNKIENFRLPIFIKRSDLIGRSDFYLVDDNLTLSFDLKISDGKYITVEDKLTTVNLPSPPLWRGDTLGRILLENKKFCDVTLKVGIEEFPVHKSVICKKSPIFDCMVTYNLQEKESGVLDIVNVSSDALKHLLHYLYTDTLDDSVLDYVDVAHLYSAAHIYQVASLVEHCSALLKSKITVENIWDIASFAATYQDTALMEASKYFISQEPSDCMKSNRLEILLQGQSLLLNKCQVDQMNISSEHQLSVETEIDRERERNYEVQGFDKHINANSIEMYDH